jgi:hypothetical protein
MAKINLNSILSETKNAVERIVETVEVAQLPLPDFDAILMEWSWRCEKGYPDFNNKKDIAALKEVLKEMNLSEIDIQGVGLTQLDEALSKEHKAAIKASESLFTAESIAKLGYSRYANKIINVFKNSAPKSSIEVLNYFIKGKPAIATFADLKTIVTAHPDDALIKGLYNVAAVDSQEGQRESGRGAMGRGEVLIGFLSQQESGGTAGADNAIGGVPFEVKASDAKSIKVPLAAKRIDRLTSLKRLDDVYFICKPLIEQGENSPWNTFISNLMRGSKLASIKKDSDKTGGSYLFDAGIAPSGGNINKQELNNFSVFFQALYEKYSEPDKNDKNEYYVNLDSISGADKFIKGVLKNPSDVHNIKVGKEIVITVISDSGQESDDLQRMESQLRQLPYVKNPKQFALDLTADVSKLLENQYIVFHETKGGGANAKVPVPVLLNPTDTRVVFGGFSLNAAIVDFSGIL